MDSDSEDKPLVISEEASQVCLKCWGVAKGSKTSLQKCHLYGQNGGEEHMMVYAMMVLPVDTGQIVLCAQSLHDWTRFVLNSGCCVLWKWVWFVVEVGVVCCGSGGGGLYS